MANRIMLNGEIIRNRLREYSMTQTSLASICGVSKSSMNNHIIGVAPCEIGEAERICTVLNLTMKEIARAPETDEPKQAGAQNVTVDVDLSAVLELLEKLVKVGVNTRSSVMTMHENLKEQLIECRKELVEIKARNNELKEEVRFLRGQLPKRN